MGFHKFGEGGIVPRIFATWHTTKRG